MRIVFVSNYFNHHQRPLSEALYDLCQGNFLFIETSPMRAERRELGYGWDDFPRYVVSAYTGEKTKQKCLAEILAADVVIAGSTPEDYLTERIRRGKLLFRYGERPLKMGAEPLKYLPRLIRWRKRNPFGKPIYLLAASGYAAEDYAKFGLFRGRSYQWGYFPERKVYDVLPEKEPDSILWVGRFLDWKHPDDLLYAASVLRAEGRLFRIKYVGTGPMKQELEALAEKLGLENCVSFLGAMKPEQVREHMERASILAFSSDRQEGWGAVVNEAMNSGCAVVASHAAGAVPFLLRDGKNGLIYRSGDVGMLAKKLGWLLDNPDERNRMAEEAYLTIAELWNAETAARRFIELAEGLKNGNSICYEDGPCAPAVKSEEKQ